MTQTLIDKSSAILLSSTEEVLQISGYRLVLVEGMPKTWRCYKRISMLGLLFEHPTHWSNAVDRIKYAEPLKAAVGLEDFMRVAGIVRV
jgi:hypothetical protein